MENKLFDKSMVTYCISGSQACFSYFSVSNDHNFEHEISDKKNIFDGKNKKEIFFTYKGWLSIFNFK